MQFTYFDKNKASFYMKDYFDSVFGNDNIKSLFKSYIENDKLSHAYMLNGPDGCGKKTFARAVAYALALHQNTEEVLLDKISSGYSPDVFTLSSSDKRIGVDAVRNFVSSMYLTPNELDFKMYIFDRADALTPQAQNALLKVIEEPPANVYIFLCCKNTAAILKTVKSRVITVNMETFSADAIRRYIEKEGSSDILYDEARLNFAFKMSDGAIGAVKALMDKDNGEYDAYIKANETVNALSKKNRETGYFDFLNIVCSFAENSDKLSLLIKYLLLIYRDILSGQNSDEPDLYIIDSDTAIRYSSVFAVRTVLSSLDIISEVKKNMAFNSNLTSSTAYLAENLWRKT